MNDSIKNYIAISGVAIAGIVIGIFCTLLLYKPRTVEIPTVEQRYVCVTNVEYKIRTVYALTNGDTQRYTNLYIDCSEMVKVADDYYREIKFLKSPKLKFAPMIGMSFPSTIPIQGGVSIDYADIGGYILGGQIVSFGAYIRF